MSDDTTGGEAGTAAQGAGERALTERVMEELRALRAEIGQVREGLGPAQRATANPPPPAWPPAPSGAMSPRERADRGAQARADAAAAAARTGDSRAVMAYLRARREAEGA